MYMITRGKSMIPLIKLSEGYSINRKNNYATCVCGSNGELLKPVKLWNEPFVFFNKERLNAEFISKTELVLVMATDMGRSYIIDIVRYKLPALLMNNTDLEWDAIRKTKPETDVLLHIEVPKGDCVFDVISDFLNDVANGNFKDVVKAVIRKFEHKDELCYGII